MTLDIETELELGQRTLILNICRGHLDLCFDDLLATFDEDAQEFLRSIPIEVLIGTVDYEKWERGQSDGEQTVSEKPKSKTKRERKKKPPRPKKAHPSSAPTTTTRTSEKADAIEEAVYSFLHKHGKAQAKELLEATQITKSQLRTATKKLIAAGKITLEGAGRGAQYSDAA